MSDKRKPTPEEVLAMQAPSTRALLTDNVDKAKAYFKGLDSKIFVTQEDMDSGKVAKPKEMSNQEVINGVIHRQYRAGIQGKPGYLSKMWKQGNAKSSKESKERAIEAYMNAPGVTAPNFDSLFTKAKKRAQSIFRIKRTKDKV